MAKAHVKLPSKSFFSLTVRAPHALALIGGTEIPLVYCAVTLPGRSREAQSRCRGRAAARPS
eukprot:12076466-Alexandrium_andersonii.AAC.1